mmetsp:Transcript_20105/g.54152  ORF Transcript_20105/g.54152 Transcript_20105/m.54152 type:complete len:221 (+) Transcript_20105:953-1615(+)
MRSKSSMSDTMDSMSVAQVERALRESETPLLPRVSSGGFWRRPRVRLVTESRGDRKSCMTMRMRLDRAVVAASCAIISERCSVSLASRRRRSAASRMSWRWVARVVRRRWKVPRMDMLECTRPAKRQMMTRANIARGQSCMGVRSPMAACMLTLWPSTAMHMSEKAGICSGTKLATRVGTSSCATRASVGLKRHSGVRAGALPSTARRRSGLKRMARAKQ